MKEDFEKRLDEIDRLAKEIAQQAREGNLDSIRLRQFSAYAAGQYGAWATVMRIIGDLKAEPTEGGEE